MTSSTGRAPVEPSADMRQFAAMMMQIYVALVQEGFSEHQAVAMIGQVLAANRPEGGRDT